MQPLSLGAELDANLDETAVWHHGDRECWVMLERDAAFSLTGPEEDLETVRQWLADNLLQLRDAVQPHLDQRRSKRSERA